MKVKIIIEVPLDELKEDIESYKEDNYNEVLPLEEWKKHYVDYFMADRSDFIDPDKIEVYFN